MHTDRASRRQTAILALVAVLAGPALAGCAAANRNPVRYPAAGITIASGSAQGVYSGYAEAYRRALGQDVPDLRVKVVHTNGSLDNLDRLGSGQAQLGFATADTAYQATIGPSQPAPNLRAIARIYDEYLHLVVPASSTVRSARDLRGLRVSTGAERSSTELTAGRVLAAAGITPEKDLVRQRFGLDASVAALRDGRIDAFFWSGGLPTPGIGDLAEAIRIRLVPLDDQVNSLRATYGAVYRRATVPSTTYPQVPQAVTVGVPNYLVVTGDLDARLVYQLTEVLFRHRGTIGAKVPSGRLLNARSAISTMPIPLHTGAERYYRDQKP